MVTQRSTSSRGAAVFGVLQLLARKHQGDRDAMAEEFEASTLCADWDHKWERLRENELDKAVSEWRKNGAPLWEDSKPAPTMQLKGEKIDGRDFDFVLNPLAGSVCAHESARQWPPRDG
jgi:hypothetical protein